MHKTNATKPPLELKLLAKHGDHRINLMDAEWNSSSQTNVKLSTQHHFFKQGFIFQQTTQWYININSM